MYPLYGFPQRKMSSHNICPHYTGRTLKFVAVPANEAAVSQPQESPGGASALNVIVGNQEREQTLLLTKAMRDYCVMPRRAPKKKEFEVMVPFWSRSSRTFVLRYPITFCVPESLGDSGPFSRRHRVDYTCMSKRS